MVGGTTGYLMVYWWVGISTTGAGSAVQIDGACSNPGGASQVMSSDGVPRTIDGAGSNFRSGQWLVYIDDTLPFTFDLSYSSPFADMRYDYDVHVTQIFQI